MPLTQRWQTASLSRNREVGIPHSPASAESDAKILAWITGNAERNAPVTRTDIKNYCREVCKIEVARMRGFVHFTPFGGIDGEEKLATRGAASAGSTSIS
jgi:hypothetical protein